MVEVLYVKLEIALQLTDDEPLHARLKEALLDFLKEPKSEKEGVYHTENGAFIDWSVIDGSD